MMRRLLTLALCAAFLGGACRRGVRAPVVAETEARGPIPGWRVAIGPSGRLASAGQVSDDGGRSWQPLVDANGRQLLPLGGRAERAPAVAPDGQRILFAEGILHLQDVPFGLGPIGHVIEWTGTVWRPWLREDPGAAASMPVRSVFFLADGNPAWVTSSGLSGPTLGLRFPAAVPAAAFLAAADGSLYVALRSGAPFPLYQQRSVGKDWEPVAGAPQVAALAETSNGNVLALGGGKCGRGRGGEWTWRTCQLPTRPDQLVTHPAQPLAAVLGPQGIAVSADEGGSWHALPLPAGLQPSWLAFDPTAADGLFVLDEGRQLHRLRFAFES